MREPHVYVYIVNRVRDNMADVNLKTFGREVVFTVW